MNSHKPYTFDRVIRIVFSLLVIVGIAWAITRLSGVLLPFVIAWLIAYLIYPLVKFIQFKLKFKFRIISIITALIVVFGVLTGLIWGLQAPVSDELQKMGGLFNALLDKPLRLNIPEEWVAYLKSSLSAIDFNDLLSIEYLEPIWNKLIPGAWSIISGSFSLIWNLTAIFFVLLYLIFILKDYEKLSQGWINLIPTKYRRFAQGLADDLESGMNAYFRGQGLIALIVGILFAIGFRIINLPMGITFGIFVGILNLVPYLQTLSIPFAILLALGKAAEYNQNVWLVFLSVAIVYVVVQSFQDLFLTPKIMGDATGLKPAIILLSLSIFGSLFGLIGMIIALPMTTLIISYYKRFVIAQESLSDEEQEIDNTPQKLPDEE